MMSAQKPKHNFNIPCGIRLNQRDKTFTFYTAVCFVSIKIVSESSFGLYLFCFVNVRLVRCRNKEIIEAAVLTLISCLMGICQIFHAFGIAHNFKSISQKGVQLFILLQTFRGLVPINLLMIYVYGFATINTYLIRVRFRSLCFDGNFLYANAYN